MKNVGNLLVIIGLGFGLFGVRSVWNDYTYRKASVVRKAKVLSVEIKDLRSKYGNYYLRPTHLIAQQLAFFRDSCMDTITLNSNFLLYSEGKTSKNPNPIPTAEELMNQEKYVRYVPESKKKETAFSERIDISDNGDYESFNRFQHFVSMTVIILLGFMIKYFSIRKVTS